MPSVCFYFQVHQPYRIRKYSFFDIGKRDDYFEESGSCDCNNEKILNKVAEKCYLPTNRLLLKLLKKYPDFKISFSFSGIALEQMERFSPETLKSFQDLIETKKVEVLSETYYHSLSFLYSEKEFKEQVAMNKEKIQDVFGVTPRVFRCTELSYSNDIARLASEMGFKGILGEGVDDVLGWRNPNFIYKPKGSDIRLFLKNYRLSDDIAYRFSEKKWKEHPLTAEKFANWVSQNNGSGEVINLFMDYETFGEHQWADSGIFQFLEALPEKILSHPDNDFVTLSEGIERYEVRDEIDVPHVTTWADTERDLSAWLGNDMQRESLRQLYQMEDDVMATNDSNIIDLWRRFQTSDQVYYMSTKSMADGNVHAYFSPYDSPYDAFIAFINALSDFKIRVREKLNNNEKRYA